MSSGARKRRNRMAWMHRLRRDALRAEPKVVHIRHGYERLDGSASDPLADYPCADTHLSAWRREHGIRVALPSGRLP